MEMKIFNSKYEYHSHQCHFVSYTPYFLVIKHVITHGA